MIARGMKVPTGRAKAILLGEHAVVYGHEALVIALPLGYAATLDHPPKGPLLAVTIEDAKLRAAWDDGSEVGRALAAAAEGLGIRVADRHEPLLVRVMGSVPSGRGLGSSAALSAVMADALAVAYDFADDRERVVKAARAADDVFHGGRASGVDAEAATRGGIGLYSKAEGFLAIAARIRLPLLALDSGQPRSTADVVRLVAERRQQDELAVVRTMQAIGKLARAGAAAITTLDLPVLGRLMDENQQLLCSLGVSTPALDALCAEAKAGGALGAKLTGAGGGGVVIALYGSQADLDDAYQALGPAKGRAAWKLPAP